jgi:hypothetical protein
MEKIKDFLSRLGLFKLVKYFLKKPYYSYRRIHFHKYSMLIFQEFMKIAEDTGVLYIPVYGTLLGFVRENKVLNHDLDIDLGLFEVDNEIMNKFEQIILQKGFIIASQVIIESTKEVIEKSYVKNKIKIDVYIMKKNTEGYRIKFWMMPNDMSLRDYQERNNGVDVYQQSFKIEDLYEKKINEVFYIKIPTNSEDILNSMYGENWKIPDKDWDGNEFYKKLKINEKGRVLI